MIQEPELGAESRTGLGLQEREALTLMGRPTHSIALPSTGASVKLVGGHGILCGFLIRENAGGVASFDLLDGDNAGGELLGSVVLAAGGVIPLQMGRDGPRWQRGLFLNILGGTIKGALWVKI